MTTISSLGNSSTAAFSPTIAAPTISSPGIGSGLNVSSIISQLMAIEQQPLTNLQTQQATDQSQISAYGQVQSALANLPTAVQALSTPQSFNVYSGTSSNSNVVSATADSTATPASYQIETSQLAQQQTIDSGAYASTSSVIGTGSLTIQLGTYNASSNSFSPKPATNPTTITIDSSNDTLSGIEAAINSANAGVTASIINDGSGNHLVVTSNQSGAANSVQITTNDADGNNTDTAGLSALAYDPTAAVGAGQNMTQLTQALDAKFTIDGVPIDEPSNTVTGAIQGVTLNLAATNVGQPATVSIAPNTQTITSAIQTFVSSYNTAESLMGSLSAYNASTNQASVLTGDNTVVSLQSQLGSILTGTTASTLSSLSSIGVTLQDDGSLAVDSTTLQNALSTNYSGVASLFAANATATDNQISVVNSTTDTQEGSYSVQVTGLATQGQLTGSSPAGLTITAGVNDQLDLMVNGTSTSVTLKPGTYASASDLATELQSEITNALGTSVSVSANGGALSITSNLYGSGSSVTVTGGDAATGLLGSAPTSASGQDVSGLINGQAATGAGQVLTATSGNAAAGLSIEISGGALGARGSVNYTEGIAQRLNQCLTNALSTTGGLATSTAGLNTDVQDLQNQESDLQNQLTQIQQRYQAQFTALDTLLSSMSETSTYLTQQMNAFDANSSSSTSSSGG
ncbi:MAG: flagellar filament capping protein FliD [Thiobacillaceae bacterium]